MNARKNVFFPLVLTVLSSLILIPLGIALSKVIPLIPKDLILLPHLSPLASFIFICLSGALVGIINWRFWIKFIGFTIWFFGTISVILYLTITPIDLNLLKLLLPYFLFFIFALIRQTIRYAKSLDQRAGLGEGKWAWIILNTAWSLTILILASILVIKSNADFLLQVFAPVIFAGSLFIPWIKINGYRETIMHSAALTTILIFLLTILLV